MDIANHLHFQITIPSKHASIVPVPTPTGFVPYILFTTCQYWLGTVPVPSYRYLQSTGKCLLAQYLLDTGIPIHPHFAGKYLLAQYHFAVSVPIPTSYWQISSGPVPFCPQHTVTNILPANIFWLSTNLLSAYW